MLLRKVILRKLRMSVKVMTYLQIRLEQALVDEEENKAQKETAKRDRINELRRIRRAEKKALKNDAKVN